MLSSVLACCCVRQEGFSGFFYSTCCSGSKSFQGLFRHLNNRFQSIFITFFNIKQLLKRYFQPKTSGNSKQAYKTSLKLNSLYKLFLFFHPTLEWNEKSSSVSEEKKSLYWSSLFMISLQNIECSNLFSICGYRNVTCFDKIDNKNIKILRSRSTLKVFFFIFRCLNFAQIVEKLNRIFYSAKLERWDWIAPEIPLMQFYGWKSWGN